MCQRGTGKGRCIKCDSRITSVKGTRGGPEAISVALVPGRVRRDAPLSSNGSSPMSFTFPSADLSTPGDGGASWTSGYGGGLGRRGEDCGETLPGADDNEEDIANLGCGGIERSDMPLYSSMSGSTTELIPDYLPNPPPPRPLESPSHSSWTLKRAARTRRLGVFGA